MDSLIDRFNKLNLDEDDTDISFPSFFSVHRNHGFSLDGSVESIIDSSMHAGVLINDQSISDLLTLFRSAVQEKDTVKARLLASTFSSYLIKTKMELASMYTAMNHILKAAAATVAIGTEQARIVLETALNIIAALENDGYITLGSLKALSVFNTASSVNDVAARLFQHRDNDTVMGYLTVTLTEAMMHADTQQLFEITRKVIELLHAALHDACYARMEQCATINLESEDDLRSFLVVDGKFNEPGFLAIMRNYNRMQQHLSDPAIDQVEKYMKGIASAALEIKVDHASKKISLSSLFFAMLLAGVSVYAVYTAPYKNKERDLLIQVNVNRKPVIMVKERVRSDDPIPHTAKKEPLKGFAVYRLHPVLNSFIRYGRLVRVRAVQKNTVLQNQVFKQAVVAWNNRQVSEPVINTPPVITVDQVMAIVKESSGGNKQIATLPDKSVAIPADKRVAVPTQLRSLVPLLQCLQPTSNSVALLSNRMLTEILECAAQPITPLNSAKRIQKEVKDLLRYRQKLNPKPPMHQQQWIPIPIETIKTALPDAKFNLQRPVTKDTDISFYLSVPQMKRLADQKSNVESTVQRAAANNLMIVEQCVSFLSANPLPLFKSSNKTDYTYFHRKMIESIAQNATGIATNVSLLIPPVFLLPEKSVGALLDATIRFSDAVVEAKNAPPPALDGIAQAGIHRSLESIRTKIDQLEVKGAGLGSVDFLGDVNVSSMLSIAYTYAMPHLLQTAAITKTIFLESTELLYEFNAFFLRNMYEAVTDHLPKDMKKLYHSIESLEEPTKDLLMDAKDWIVASSVSGKQVISTALNKTTIAASAAYTESMIFANTVSEALVAYKDEIIRWQESVRSSFDLSSVSLTFQLIQASVESTIDINATTQALHVLSESGGRLRLSFMDQLNAPGLFHPQYVNSTIPLDDSDYFPFSNPQQSPAYLLDIGNSTYSAAKLLPDDSSFFPKITLEAPQTPAIEVKPALVTKVTNGVKYFFDKFAASLLDARVVEVEDIRSSVSADISTAAMIVATEPGSVTVVNPNVDATVGAVAAQTMLSTITVSAEDNKSTIIDKFKAFAEATMHDLDLRLNQLEKFAVMCGGSEERLLSMKAMLNQWNTQWISSSDGPRTKFEENDFNELRAVVESCFLVSQKLTYTADILSDAARPLISAAREVVSLHQESGGVIDDASRKVIEEAHKSMIGQLRVKMGLFNQKLPSPWRNDGSFIVNAVMQRFNEFTKQIQTMGTLAPDLFEKSEYAMNHWDSYSLDDLMANHQPLTTHASFPFLNQQAIAFKDSF